MSELEGLSSRSSQVLADLVIVGVRAEPDDLRSVRTYMELVSRHEMTPDRPSVAAFVDACGDLAEALETSYGGIDGPKPGDREDELPVSIITGLKPGVREVLATLVRTLMLARPDELDRLRKLFARLPELVEEAGANPNVEAYVRRCNRLIAPAGQHELES